ncbi:hypothetical protein MOSE0_H02344 [Monosporozyma servazzii]
MDNVERVYRIWKLLMCHCLSLKGWYIIDKLINFFYSSLFQIPNLVMNEKAKRENLFCLGLRKTKRPLCSFSSDYLFHKGKVINAASLLALLSISIILFTFSHSSKDLTGYASIATKQLREKRD